ncbi:IucA/IucC family protein [Paenibacillus sp. OAS669]|uniref:IucA/IucC family protein n=1 Tax=Paenibacillus sp. OAS669 TaxID=2663821 RepID=UPI00178AA971|nr:IucA/IucC family protein [Paenibacillus sp. OAS669]MBE1445840.1 siderophore synthetase component [Paenibacillus sp. OAS669]
MNGPNILQNENFTPTAPKDVDWAKALSSPQYAQVERRILRQLAEALLYENIAPYSRSSSEGAVDTFLIQAVDTKGQAVAYMIRGRTTASFDRIRLNRIEPIVRRDADGVRSEARLEQFVIEVLGPHVPEERLGGFLEELVQTLLKDTQSQYVNRHRELSGEERMYDALEGNIMDGHPYHPCYKSRIGFNGPDNATYGPEFQPLLKPLWLALPAEDSVHAISASLQSYEAFMEAELGMETIADFTARLEAAGINPQQVRYLPVHPWQWRETALRVLYRHLADRQVVVLGEGQDGYRPQQSIRTLANATSRHKPYVKLPMNLVNTSTGRMLAKHTILNAPLISDWLSGLVRQDTEAQQMDFVLLREVAGVAYDHETLPELLRPRAYGALGAIWRESLHLYLRDGEEAVPFNALCHLERSGKPFIDTWVQNEGVEAWTWQLLEAAVLPLIHLLFAHGVALESHAQNMILLHREGRPTRVAFKDFHDGIRFSRRHLAHPEACPPLHSLSDHHRRINPNSFIETDQAEGVRDFVHDAFFFINMTELCFLLEDHYGLSEKAFWQMTAQLIHDYCRKHPQHEARFQAFDLFADTIEVEQLTARRLFGDTELRLQKASNPLRPYR